MKIKFIFFIIYISILINLYSQKADSNLNSEESPFPLGFLSIKLNMNKENVIVRLSKESIFDTSDQEKLSFRNEPDKEILKIRGINFIKMAYFHFYNDILFQITLDLDMNKISYYDVLIKLQNKYGKPIKFTPETANWENNTIKLSLQRPVILKYISINISKELLEESKESSNFYKISREKFLNSL